MTALLFLHFFSTLYGMLNRLDGSIVPTGFSAQSACSVTRSGVFEQVPEADTTWTVDGETRTVIISNVDHSKGLFAQCVFAVVTGERRRDRE